MNFAAFGGPRILKLKVISDYKYIQMDLVCITSYTTKTHMA